VTTNAALHFFDSKDVLAEVLTDQDEWNVYFSFLTDKHMSASSRRLLRADHLSCYFLAVEMPNRHGKRCQIQLCILR